jgi:hypothetical protein
MIDIYVLYDTIYIERVIQMQKKDRFIDVLFEFLKELAASLILVVIPLVGLIIMSLIIPKNFMEKIPDELMMFFGFLTILFILYMIAAVVALVIKIKKVIVKDKSQDLIS